MVVNVNVSAGGRGAWDMSAVKLVPWSQRLGASAGFTLIFVAFTTGVS